MKLFRSLIVLALVGVLACVALPAQACVGARALGMGGAFTGLADDVSATYWNPAALPYLGQKSATYMHVFNDDINYQDYLAYAQPLDEKSAFGLSYINFNFLTIDAPFFSVDWDQKWYWLSYGIKVSDKTALGLNYKFTQDDIEVVDNGVELPYDADSDNALDLAVYHRATDNVTLGLLVQNVNEPDVNLEFSGMSGTFQTWTRNWRPGAAVRLQDGVTLAAELYDATDDADMRALRLGVEKKFADQQFALRAGRYAAGDIEGLTLGAGLWRDNWTADVAFLAGDLDNTWVASATFNF